MKLSKFADAQFWQDTFDRALASFGQALVTVGVFEEVGLLGADWAGALSIAGGFAVASAFTSIAYRGGADKDLDGPGK